MIKELMYDLMFLAGKSEVATKEDLQVFGRLTAISPTEERDSNGSVVWELLCECGNTTYKTINTLRSGKVLSCGCLYKESRSKTIRYRRDLLENTSLGSLVLSKKLNSRNKSGYTGVWLNSRTGKWEAMINFQKVRYRHGSFENITDAIEKRRKEEQELHDPFIVRFLDNLTEQKKNLPYI